MKINPTPGTPQNPIRIGGKQPDLRMVTTIDVSRLTQAIDEAAAAIDRLKTEINWLQSASGTQRIEL